MLNKEKTHAPEQRQAKYAYPCPSCQESHCGTMEDNFVVTCKCGCKYDGIINAANIKRANSVRSLEKSRDFLLSLEDWKKMPCE